MKKTVLVVEDSKSIRTVLSETLVAHGYDVVEAEDGKDGVEQLDGGKVDLIISDLNMPNMDGLEFVAACRSNPQYKFTPIIMLTTVTDESFKAKGRMLGVRIWMSKPFAEQELVDVVEKLTS